jgi:hypothetical protein
MHHEIWLDEAQHYLIARDSNNLQELWKNTRYEGHPILWNLILYAITRLSWNPLSMQLIHWLIGISAISIFLFNSPLKKSWNYLFCFGYFTLFEYTVISRNYSLLLLFFFLSLKYFPIRSKNKIAFGLSLFLLTNTHLFGLIIAFWILMVACIDFDGSKISLVRFDLIKMPLFFFIVGAILCVLQCVPPSDSPFMPITETLLSIKSIKITSLLFLRSFWPIPDFTSDYFWNTSFFSGHLKWMGGILSILAFALSLILIQKRRPLILFCGSTLCILVVIVILYPNSIAQASRHFGIIYIIFIGSLWIGHYENDWRRLLNFSDRFKNIALHTLLTIQLIAGGIAILIDYRNPFSESKNISVFLEQNNLSNYPVFTFVAPIPSVSSHLQKKIYSIPSGELISFFHWNEKAKYMSFKQDKDVLESAKKIIRSLKKDGILIAYLPIEESKEIKLLKHFNSGVVKSENFYLYKVHYSD